MIIFNKKTKTENDKKLYSVRMLGVDTWLSEEEFERQVVNKNVFFKANKPVYEKDFA
jgi:hypothetical protein